MARPAEPAVSAAPDETADGAPARKSKKKLFVILGLVVLLGAGGAGAWFFTQGKDASGKSADEAPKVPVFLAH